MTDTIESLQAQVSAFTAENMALKARIAGYYNANCALGYRNSQLEQLGMTAVHVAQRNTFLEDEVIRLEDALTASKKEKAKTLAETECVRQKIHAALRELPQRR
jgi:hypothetical protein